MRMSQGESQREIHFYLLKNEAERGLKLRESIFFSGFA
jgi:hypothetical protein